MMHEHKSYFSCTFGVRKRVNAAFIKSAMYLMPSAIPKWLAMKLCSQKKKNPHHSENHDMNNKISAECN